MHDLLLRTSCRAASAALAIYACFAGQQMNAEEPGRIRFATFNTSLNRKVAGKLIEDLRADDEQARKVAEVLQRVRPDVVLLNEFDYDPQQRAAKLFRDNYLRVGQGGAQPLTYDYWFTAAVNTGLSSGRDLNQDGQSDGPEDAFGFGRHPGQFGMLVLSRLPIDKVGVRTFQKFLWSDMPKAQRPKAPESGRSYYRDEDWRTLRLSSKSFWDLPISVGDVQIHLLASHPTPPVFDGAEDRNGLRNHDEIRMLADYVSLGQDDYLYDDRGVKGGLDKRAQFVIVGDLNADPLDGDSSGSPIARLLEHPRINATATPGSQGAVESAQRTQATNAAHKGPPAHDTASFGGRVGNLRIDYVLPSSELKILDSGVFWPTRASSTAKLLAASDHRLVWVEVAAPGAGE